MILRPYQQQCVHDTVDALYANSSALSVLATGLGKTVIFSFIAKEFMQWGRVMIAAHMEELLDQAGSKIRRITGVNPEIEMAEFRARESGLYEKSPVVLATRQTLVSGRGDARRMHKFDPNEFGLLIIDEAHQGVNKSYRTIIKHFRQNPRLRVLGVTATPDRSDEIALGNVFKVCAFKYPIKPAIDDGWLVDIRQQLVEVESLDFSKCHTAAGDFKKDDLALAIGEYPETIRKFVHSTFEAAGDRRTLYFADSVDNAGKATELFNGHQRDCARLVVGSTPRKERQRIISDYREGRFKFLVNVGVATHGFDVPGISCVVMARPTKSRALYEQMCLHEQAEILTPQGWVGIDDPKPDCVASFIPETGKIVWSFVRRKIKRPIAAHEYMVGIDGQQVAFSVTHNHRMLARRRFGRKRDRTPWAWHEASDLLNLSDAVEIPVSGLEEKPGLDVTCDELRFWGLVATDGNINPANNQISIHQAEGAKHVDNIRQCLKSIGVKFTEKTYDPSSAGRFKTDKRSIRWTISHGAPRGSDKHKYGWGALRIAPLMGKEIPYQFNDISAEQLGYVLEAMHWGDGSKQDGQSWTRRSYHICTKRKTVADALQSLCVRRGWACNVSRPDGIWWIHCKHKQSRTLAITRKRKDQGNLRIMPSSGQVWCVETEAGTIITRWCGKVTIMGNCGRGTRPIEEDGRSIVDKYDTAEARRAAIAASDKPNVLVLDFVGNSGQHKLVHSLDILGGIYTDEEIELAKKTIVEIGGACDPEEELERAREKLRKAKEKAEAIREANRRAARAVARAKYTTMEVSPFDVLDLAPPREKDWPAHDDITPAQRAFLEKFRVDGLDEMSKRDAGRLVGEIKRRLNEGLCTYRQAMTLKKHGMDPNMTFEEASVALDRLFGWGRRELKAI